MRMFLLGGLRVPIFFFFGLAASLSGVHLWLAALCLDSGLCGWTARRSIPVAALAVEFPGDGRGTAPMCRSVAEIGCFPKTSSVPVTTRGCVCMCVNVFMCVFLNVCVDVCECVCMSS